MDEIKHTRGFAYEEWQRAERELERHEAPRQ